MGYSKKCLRCNKAGEEQWFLNEPVRQTSLIAEIDEGGYIQDIEVVEVDNNGCGLLRTYYECTCGHSYLKTEWEKLEVVKI